MRKIFNYLLLTMLIGGIAAAVFGYGCLPGTIRASSSNIRLSRGSSASSIVSEEAQDSSSSLPESSAPADSSEISSAASSEISSSSPSSSESSAANAPSEASPPVVSSQPEPQAAVTLTVDSRKAGGRLLSLAVPWKSGDTVYSILQRAKSEGLLTFSIQNGASVYVNSMDGHAEFDINPQSGWIFNVNGSYPGVGCNSVAVDKGGTINWIYTLDDGATEEGKK